LEMAGSIISKRLLEIISNRSAGNRRNPGQQPFPDFQGHFHGHAGRRPIPEHLQRLGSLRPKLMRGACSSLSPGQASPVFWHSSPDAPSRAASRVLVLYGESEDASRFNEAAATSPRKPRTLAEFLEAGLFRFNEAAATSPRKPSSGSSGCWSRTCPLQ
jgi:hypothetical protein